MKRIVLLLIAGIMAVSLTGCAGSRAFQRGEGYARHNDWDLAVKEYRDANARDPENIEYRSALLRAEETAANQHYKKARNFVKERKFDQAIVELQQALFLNPTNAAVQGALKAVLNMKEAEEHYRASLTYLELGRLTEAINELNQATELEPENQKYHDSLEKLQKKKTEAEPEEALTLASDKPITLNLKNTSVKEAFELLSKISGINILFDEEVKGQPVTVFLKDVSFQQALNLLLSTNKLFMKKINADTIIIIPKSKAKTDQYQDLVVKTFYLSTAKSKEMVNLLRSMLDTKKVYVNEAVNSITIRDTPEKIKLVEKVIAANDLKEAEVVLDVEILEINRSKALQYGWNFNPGLTVGASLQSSAASSTTSSTTTPSVPTSISLSQLRNLSGDNVMLTVPGIVLNLLKQDSDAQMLANPRVRVLNNKKAQFHIGDKIPIQTSTVQSTTYAATTSTFEYKDVGIKFNIEPLVHLNSTVTLKLELEISNLGDAIDFGNGQKAYKFGTRKTDTTINLRDGETVIIGGLIKDEERKSTVKIPLLGDIPVLGKLFSSENDGTIKTDILMSITPNIVRPLEIPDKDVQSFWSGTEDTYDIKPLFVSSTTKSARLSAKAVDKTAVLDSLAKRETPAQPGAVETAKLSPQPAGPEPVPTPPVAASLAVTPADAVSKVGQESIFVMSAANVKELYGAIITLAYDPKVVEFKSAGEGQLLKKDGQQTSFLFSNNVRAGTVDIYITRIGDVGGVDGAGGLFTVAFQAKAGGKSDIYVKGIKLTNFNREQIKADAKGATVTVK